MNTPICDFVQKYNNRNAVRLHMPGHKGVSILGPETLDITEIDGADVLYQSNGIIKESENNASTLFGTAKTLYSTEGSSLCIRAMLHMVKLYSASKGIKPVIAAARNAHKVFITAAALLDIDIAWLYSENNELLSCSLDIDKLDKFLHDQQPTAVYITSPDYLGNMVDIEKISKLCHSHDCILIVDNAHGAYLKFLPKSLHPIDLGADICCDSAHKTLPVLTGGAYLHISENAPKQFIEQSENSMSLFASTSPSYLILQSLDKANVILDNDFRSNLNDTLKSISELKQSITQSGYTVIGDEPLKLTIFAKDYGYTGNELASILENENIVCEFFDPDFVVMMFSYQTSTKDINYLKSKLKSIPKLNAINERPPILKHPQMLIRPNIALMSPFVITDVKEAEGKILASASVNCPPAIPIVTCGELIDDSAVRCFEYYGIKKCYTVIENKE